MGSSEDVKENTVLLLLLLFRGIAMGSRTHTRQWALEHTPGNWLPAGEDTPLPS